MLFYSIKKLCKWNDYLCTVKLSKHVTFRLFNGFKKSRRNLKFKIINFYEDTFSLNDALSTSEKLNIT